MRKGVDLDNLLQAKGHRPSNPTTVSRIFYAVNVRSAKWAFLTLFVTLILASIAIFLVGALEDFKELEETVPQTYSYFLAHGFAQVTKLCGALILFPMLRSSLTWFRSTRIGRKLPTDLHVSFHKLVGRVMFLAGGLHSAGWVYRVSTLGFNDAIGGPGQFGSQINSPFPEFATGFATLFVMLIIYFLSFDAVRRYNYELFYYSHWLWVVFMILMFVHGENFWMWGTLPSLLWAVDYGFRIRRQTIPITDVDVCVLPGGVMQIEFPKIGFDYQPGQYLLLNAPKVSQHEWHPFTISSSPTDPYVTLHVKIAGDWTEGVKEMLGPVTNSDHHARISSIRVSATSILKLDGPFGAPTQDYNNYESVIFAGLGIGNTPFVSVLRYLKYKIEAEMRGLVGAEKIKVRHIYFMAICPDEDSILWFSDVMHALTSFPGGFLKIYLFLTQFKDTEEGRTSSGTGVGELEFPVFESGYVPTVYSGRPDFEKFVRKVARRQPPGSDVGVFFCGPRTAGRSMEDACIKVTNASKVNCVFHKENF